MAPRANWKGYLKLSLVSCAVNLYPASSTSSRVSFNTINRKTGNKVKRQFVDAETGEVVENETRQKATPSPRIRTCSSTTMSSTRSRSCDLAARVRDRALQRRGELLARAAPRCPEIHQ